MENTNTNSTESPLTYAVIGCLHGLLDKMYDDLLNW